MSNENRNDGPREIHTADNGAGGDSSLIPMLVAGLVLIVLGMILTAMFF
jgi:hypothetical protein